MSRGQDQELQIQFEFPESVSEEERISVMANYVDALDALNRDEGGPGLEVRSAHAPAPQEGPSLDSPLCKPGSGAPEPRVTPVHGVGLPKLPRWLRDREAEEIQGRRGNAGLETDAGKRLVGLALSGGGIRSASFNLGLMQALERNGVFRHVDYLSTVSGGGYIGSALSALSADPATFERGRAFPFALEDGPEGPAIQHVRDRAGFLSPHGQELSALTAPLALLGGALYNLLVLSVLPVSFALLVVFGHYTALVSDRASTAGTFFRASPYALLICVASALVFAVSRGQRPSLLKRFSMGLSAVIFLFTVFLFVFESLGYVYYLTELSAPLNGLGSFESTDFLREIGKQLARLASQAAVVTAIGLGALIPLLRIERVWGALDSKLGTIGLWVLGLSSLLLLFFIFLVSTTGILFLWEIIASQGRKGLAPWIVLVVVLVVLAVLVFLPRRFGANSTGLHVVYRDALRRAFLLAWTPGGGVIEAEGLKLSKLHGSSSSLPFHLINTTINVQASVLPRLRGRQGDVFTFSKVAVGSHPTGFVETTAMERADPSFELDTAMAVSGAAASPNMGSMSVSPLRWLLTLLNIRLSYWLPNPLFFVDKQQQASPGGSFAGSSWERGTPLEEFLNRLDERHAYVLLSDGGHHENLGVLPLLERRCKLIIVGDAESDPTLSCGALGRVIRLARTDMDIEIEINLSELRLNESRRSAQHCALGTIHYGSDHEIGHLLYIKSSLTGDENAYVEDRRLRHPDFPHRTTADQFFDEEQFEAYRALGFHATNTLFRDGVSRAPAAPERWESQEAFLKDWLDDLEDRLSVSLDDEVEFVQLQEALASIEQALAKDTDAAMTQEIFPELNFDAQHDHGRFHLVCRQVQFMEDVYVGLGLKVATNRSHPRNRGWMNLFRRWADAQTFRSYFPLVVCCYSRGFQRFCERHLELELQATWARLGVGLEQLTPTQEEALQRHKAILEGTKRIYVASLGLKVESQGPATPVAWAVVDVRGGVFSVEDLEVFRGFEGLKVERWLEDLRKAVKSDRYRVRWGTLPSGHRLSAAGFLARRGWATYDLEPVDEDPMETPVRAPALPRTALLGTTLALVILLGLLASLLFLVGPTRSEVDRAAFLQTSAWLHQEGRHAEVAHLASESFAADHSREWRSIYLYRLARSLRYQKRYEEAVSVTSHLRPQTNDAHDLRYEEGVSSYLAALQEPEDSPKRKEGLDHATACFREAQRLYREQNADGRANSRYLSGEIYVLELNAKWDEALRRLTESYRPGSSWEKRWVWPVRDRAEIAFALGRMSRASDDARALLRVATAEGIEKKEPQEVYGLYMIHAAAIALNPESSEEDLARGWDDLERHLKLHPMFRRTRLGKSYEEGPDTRFRRRRLSTLKAKFLERGQATSSLAQAILVVVKAQSIENPHPHRALAVSLDSALMDKLPAPRQELLRSLMLP